MGILDKKMGFIRYDRWIVFVIAAVVAFYGYCFYQAGYSISWLFFLWGALAVGANFLVKTKPVVAFGGLAVVSFILYYTLRYSIEEMRETPHFEIFAVILTMSVGIAIDSIYWVYKYKKGETFKTSYDD